MDETIIRTVIYTLGTIEVHGRDNLSRLLGCINALENLLKEEAHGNTHQKSDGGN